MGAADCSYIVSAKKPPQKFILRGLKLRGLSSNHINLLVKDLIKRIQVTHSLVLHYNLHKKMNLYRPRMATKSDLCTFHSQEYIDFLSRVTTENMSSYTRELEKFSVGLANGDTPLFGGKVFLRPYSHFTHPLSKPPLFSIFGNFQAGIRYWQTVFVLCSLLSLVTRKDYNL